jgi:hypothetical protein
MARFLHSQITPQNGRSTVESLDLSHYRMGDALAAALAAALTQRPSPISWLDLRDNNLTGPLPQLADRRRGASSSHPACPHRDALATPPEPIHPIYPIHPIHPIHLIHPIQPIQPIDWATAVDTWRAGGGREFFVQAPHMLEKLGREFGKPAQREEGAGMPLASGAEAAAAIVFSNAATITYCDLSENPLVR